MFGRVIAAIGAPAVIAALSLAPRMRTEMIRQIALVEIMARKLLLADAVDLIPSQRGPRLVEVKLNASGLYTCPQIRRRTPSRPRAIDPAKPETWPARFALALPRVHRAVQDRRAMLWRRALAPTPPPRRERQSSAFTIARRAEALRRMLENPAPYAQRLATARRIGVNRSREAVTRYALRAPRRFVGDRTDPKLTLDIYSVVVNARAILLVDTS